MYLMCHDQYIMSGMGGPVALQNSEIIATMGAMDVEDKMDCLWRVRLIGREVIRLRREARDDGGK